MRITTSDWEGFADVHPWPEFGDAPIEAQLSSLLARKPLPLAARTLEHARWDGEARARGKSAFAGLEVPASHWLCADLAALTEDDLARAHAAGFQALKAKVGRDWPAEMARWLDLAGDWPEGLRLRLDFNSSLSCAQFASAWEGLPGALRANVEFVEDPCPWNAEDWRTFAAPLAFDRPKGGDEAPPAGGPFDVVILKPAVQEPITRRPARVVVTSYLDHPVGQAAAALAAGRLNLESICGLRSHGVYEPNAFAEALGPADVPAWTAPEGVGIGFDSLLQHLDWKLCE